MKLRTKSIITLVTMLLGGIGQIAAQDGKPLWPPQTTTIIQLNGSSKSADAAGTLTVSISNPDENNGKATATLTAKPATGNYITKDQIAVIRTIDGRYAQTREASIDNTPLELTEMTPNNDPSGETKYTFEIEATPRAHTRAEWQGFIYYDYEITANFQSKIDIKDAKVQVAGTYEATGEAITVEADKVKVTVGGKELAANEFEISGYENNTKPGDATIKIAGLRQYTGTATGTFTINRGQGQGYGLWINDIQVTEDNQDDVLGNSADSKSGTMGTIVFNPKKNTLVMTNDVSNVEIESRLESLTLHINDVNQVKRIFYNNLGDATNTGELIITTNGNFPGQLIIKNDAGKSAISGFSKLTLEQDLLFVEPELIELKNGELYQYDFKKVDKTDPESKLIKDDTTEAICNAVTIGVIITPLTQNVTVLLSKGDDFIVKDENGNPVTDTNGNPVPASLKNFALSKDILLTIWTEVDEQNSQAGQEVDAGFDDSDGKPGITMVNTMTDAQVQKVAKDVLKNIIMPGGTSFAYEFNGVTFIVPAGSGSIIIDQETDPGYEYHLAPIGLNETYNLVIGGAKIEKYELLGGNRVRLTIDYSNLPTQTYYLLYLTQEASSGARGGTRLGKRDKAHGKLYSVGVRPRSITDVNPASVASDGVIDEEEDPEGVIDNPTPPSPPTGIQTVASESSVNSNKWFTADGRQLEGRPTKPGFYIRNGKKVVIK